MVVVVIVIVIVMVVIVVVSFSRSRSMCFILLQEVEWIDFMLLGRSVQNIFTPASMRSVVT